ALRGSDGAELEGPAQGRRPAGTGRGAIERRVPAERLYRKTRGLHHLLQRDRQQGPAIPAPVRLRRLADHRAAGADVGAVDPARSLSVKRTAKARRFEHITL